MKLIICGYARHGKDTAAEYLRDRMGMKFESSSRFAMRRFLRAELERQYNLFYNDGDSCYDDRVNHRSKWFRLISDFNKRDLTQLGRTIFEENDIYVGLRCGRELAALQEASVPDLTIWIDASRRLTPESTISNTITPDMCDVTITNNGHENQMFRKLMALFSFNQ